MEYPLYNQNAENIGKVNLPDSVFGLSENKDLLYQVVTSQISNKRQNIAHTKQRGEVRGGGKKPWRQKGTGRARHGSSRSPIWKGGGVTFGPRSERNFKKKINRKMARKGLSVALSSKTKKNEITVVDNLIINDWKTKEMAKIIKGLSGVFQNRRGSILVIVPEKSTDTIQRAVRNLPKTDIIQARNLNALEVVSRKNIILLEKSVQILNRKS